MADGAYRWQGHAPAPDAARIEAIDAAWDEAGVDAFAEPARAAAVDRIEAALAAARTGDLAEAAARLADARAALQGLDPAALEPRRGLAGLFDSRGRRLKRFRAAYRDAAARRSGALEAVWGGLRNVVADLDAHLAAAARRLTGHAPAEDDPAPPLAARKAALDACRAAALRSLPLIRGFQNADARASEALRTCGEGLTTWRDDWREALGLSGKRPRRIRPDAERLARSRDQVLARLDRTLAEFKALGARRNDVEGRLAALRTRL